MTTTTPPPLSSPSSLCSAIPNGSRSPVSRPGLATCPGGQTRWTCARSPAGAAPRSVSPFSVRRADIEAFARELEARGRARATVTRRLCTVAGFYRYAVEEELLEYSPAAHVRRPRPDYQSHATALDRNELGAILVAAGLGPPAGLPAFIRRSRLCP